MSQLSGRGIMRLVPWWLMLWSTKRFRWCWSSMVTLKLNGCRYFLAEQYSLRPRPQCFENLDGARDYCGWYGADHPCHQEAQRRLDADPRPTAAGGGA